MNNLEKKLAFTLAEVLITIGIIGIVSVLVIPTIIGNQDMIISKNKFKKTISVLNEAGKMSKVQYGYDYSDVNRNCGSEPPLEDDPVSSTSFCSLFNGTIKNHRYLGHVTYQKWDSKHAYLITPKSAEWNSSTMNYNRVVYQLQDGVLIAVEIYDTKDCHLENGEVLNGDWIKTHMGCVGFIDVNGLDLPNREVSCSDGTTTLAPEKTCIVKKDTRYLSDVYPIVFHDSVVEPASNAAKYILMN